MPRNREVDLATAHPESLDLIGALGGAAGLATSGQVDDSTDRAGSSEARGSASRLGTSGQVDLGTGGDDSPASSDVDQTMRGPDSAGSDEVAAADVSTSRDLDEVPAYPDAARAAAAAGGSASAAASERSDRTGPEGRTGTVEVAGPGRSTGEGGRTRAQPAVDDKGEELADPERL